MAYTGDVFWSDHSGSDDDYNLDLVSPDSANPQNPGLTDFAVSVNSQSWVTGNPSSGTSPPRGLHLEFDSDETIDHFHTSWWNDFHKGVDADQANPMGINGKFAIAIGLLGLDCEHNCWTELHPIFVLAIRTQASVTDDRWSFFVRNRGNEGYCSDGSEVWETGQIALFLPQPGASDVQLASAEVLFGPDDMSAAQKAAVSGPSVSLVPGRGALVTFTLPGPDSGVRMNGAMQLVWQVSNTPNAGMGLAAEEAFAQRLEKLNAAQRSIYNKLVEQATPCNHPSRSRSPCADTGISIARLAATRQWPIRPPGPPPERGGHVQDLQRDRFERAKLKALEQAERSAARSLR